MKISELVSEGALGSFAGNFVKNATSGRIDPTNPNIGVGAQLGSALASAAGLKGTANAISDKGYAAAAAQQASGTQGGMGTQKINPNQPVDMPPLGKVKIKPAVGGGLEIDTRGTPLEKQGIPKLNIDRQTLQQMQAGVTRR
jgi:hypothetical protein